jgi:hypothetical protein
MLNILIAAVAASSVVASQPQDAPAPAAAVTRDTRIPGEAIREDLAILRRVYTELHPGLYRYRTPQEIAKGFDDLEAKLGGGATLGETYLEISRLLATIRCGHTYANFFNQGKTVREAVLEGRTRIPFAFRWIDGRIVVTDSWCSPPIARGTEVAAINGVESPRLLRELLPLVRADGGNDAKRRKLLEVEGRDQWETFDVFFPLVFPWTGEEFALTLIAPDGGRSERSVRAMTREEREQAVKAAAKATGATVPRPVVSTYDGWDFQVLPSGPGLLRMDGWALYNSDWNWREYLDKVVDHAIDAGVRDLIVDIRANEGGLDCGDTLIERLIDRDLAVTNTERLVRYRKIPEDLSKYLDTWDDLFRDWGDRARDLKDGFYTLADPPGEASSTAIAPRGRRYTGRVWVLVGPTNSSATFQFAAIMKARNLGTLVGEQTGGNQRGINGGAFFFALLPRTRIEVDLPLIKISPARGASDPLPPDAGIEPDVRVEETRSDIAAGRDAVLERTLELIKSRK